MERRGDWRGGTLVPAHVRRLDRELGRKRVADVSARDLEAFVAAPEAAATRNRALTMLRSFFAWAGRCGLAEGDPTDGLIADALLNRIGAQPWIVDHVILGHARPKLPHLHADPVAERGA